VVADLGRAGDFRSTHAALSKGFMTTKDTAGNYLPGFLTSAELAKLLALSPKRVAVHFSVSWMIRTF
jgi:hypothetical protein